MYNFFKKWTLEYNLGRRDMSNFDVFFSFNFRKLTSTSLKKDLNDFVNLIQQELIPTASGK